MKKRGISILLVLCMIFTLLPFGAFAAEEEPAAAKAVEEPVAVSEETPAEEPKPANENENETKQETEEHSASWDAPRLNAAASPAMAGAFDSDAAIAYAAADFYNAQNAVAWALNESEHQNNKGLKCSPYCRMCLEAGGLKIPEDCGLHPNRLSTWAVENGLGTMLPTDDDGIDQMSPGDLVIVYCENHGQPYSYGIHCIFVTSVEASGFRYCANNEYRHNVYMSFADLKTYQNSFSCKYHGQANVQTFILHMWRDLTPPEIVEDTVHFAVRDNQFRLSFAARDNHALTEVYASVWQYGQTEENAIKEYAQYSFVPDTDVNISIPISLDSFGHQTNEGIYYWNIHVSDGVNCTDYTIDPSRNVSNCINLFQLAPDTSKAGTYKVISDAPVRDAPYQTWNGKDTKGETLKKGETVTCFGKYVNDHNHDWYQINDGRWIYGEHLKKYTSWHELIEKLKELFLFDEPLYLINGQLIKAAAGLRKGTAAVTSESNTSAKFYVTGTSYPVGSEPPAVSKATIHFDANGGICSRSSVSYPSGSAYGWLPTPSRFGYSFDGWFTAAEGGSQVTAESVCASSGATLYAHWTRIVLLQGSCGDDMTFILYGDGELDITGSGEMTSHPWTEDYTNNVFLVNMEGEITNISEDAFSDCIYLHEVNLAPSLEVIESNAFYHCEDLEQIEIPDTVTEIGYYTFAGSGLTAVEIPDSVTFIDHYAFCDCSNLATVKLSDSLQSLGTEAFARTPITSVEIPKTLTECGGFSGPFSECPNLKTASFQNGTTLIAEHVFDNCTGLETVTIPSTVTEIGYEAFVGSGLTSVEIPDSVTRIDNYAFNNCSNLATVKLSDSLQSLGTEAFARTPITSVEIPKTLTECGGFSGPFSECPNLKTASFQNGTTLIAEHVFDNCTGLETVTIPSTVTEIGYEAFVGSGLTSVEIPDSVTRIDDGAFNDCSSLTNVQYCGTEAQKAAITIDDNNDPLLNASWSYGHLWDAGVVTQEPTASAEGVKTFTCTVCGETRTESIPKLTNPFTDVAKGKFYYDPVLWAISQDPVITTGVTDTTFMPDRICTRAHVVTFLWRANGCPEPTDMTNTFKDVPNGKYYTKAVLWAAETGITTGYSDGTFRPDDECTRGQVVTFLWRAKGSPKPTGVNNPFSDVPTGKYYTSAILWALKNNITQGRTATTFGPDDACTRGHVVTFLYRAYH